VGVEDGWVLKRDKLAAATKNVRSTLKNNEKEKKKKMIAEKKNDFSFLPSPPRRVARCRCAVTALSPARAPTGGQGRTRRKNEQKKKKTKTSGKKKDFFSFFFFPFSFSSFSLAFSRLVLPLDDLVTRVARDTKKERKKEERLRVDTKSLIARYESRCVGSDV